MSSDTEFKSIFPQKEAEIQAKWDENDTFRKSVEQNNDKEYIFFDGPPFANGLPHYGHLLTGFVKDTYARYHTMFGEKVERRFGWDCHGLPAEMEVEKELKASGTKVKIDDKELEVSGRLPIEKYGIDKFNEQCRESVMKYSGEWENYVNRQGRWVDFQDQYKTMDTSYMESVMWAFAELYKKGLVYSGQRVMPYSWKCQTPLSNFETRMDNSYREKESKSVTVKFEVDIDVMVAREYYQLVSRVNHDIETLLRLQEQYNKNPDPSTLPSGVEAYMYFAGADGYNMLYDYQIGRKNFISITDKLSKIDIKINNTYSINFLAWTTTPWTLPSNLALAVGRDIEYTAFLNEKSKEIIIIASALTKKYEKELKEYKQLDATFKGSEFEGFVYKPLFPYIEALNGEFRVLIGDFVTIEDGTGIVHMAPGFGEDDYNLCQASGIPVLCPIDDGGCFDDRIFDISYSLKQQDGTMKDEILKLRGRCVLEDQDGKGKYNDVNDDIIKYLKSFGEIKYTTVSYADIIKPKYIVSTKSTQWFKTEQYFHNYPHCWRTDTPLIYRAISSWYVDITGEKLEIKSQNRTTSIRQRMVELNKDINWIPNHIRDGQFGKWLEGARDWSISRNRFWGCPIPVWQYDNNDVNVFASIQELEEFFGKNYIKNYEEYKEAKKNGTLEACPYKDFKWKYIQEDGSFKITDLHRPYIDELVLSENGKITMRRVTDVLDCWFESGSMPFASVHYPFDERRYKRDDIAKYYDFSLMKPNNSFDPQQNKPQNFPADFIVEYVAQTRGWFYTLMILGTALFDSAPFKNCICHGVILDENAQKLSKRLRNYPDPKEMFDLYGSDSMRWLMMRSQVMRGGDFLIDKDGSGIRDISKNIINTIWNSFVFFKTYVEIDKVKTRDLFDKENSHLIQNINNIMDRYILSLTSDAIYRIKKAVDEYDTSVACSIFEQFIDNLNNWYIRRSRDRFWDSIKIDVADVSDMRYVLSYAISKDRIDKDLIINDYYDIILCNGFYNIINSDKKSAYDTLYTAIMNIVKAIAPLLPYMSDYIYSEIIKFEDNSKK